MSAFPLSDADQIPEALTGAELIARHRWLVHDTGTVVARHASCQHASAAVQIRASEIGLAAAPRSWRDGSVCLHGQGAYWTAAPWQEGVAKRPHRLGIDRARELGRGLARLHSVPQEAVAGPFPERCRVIAGWKSAYLEWENLGSRTVCKVAPSWRARVRHVYQALETRDVRAAVLAMETADGTLHGDVWAGNIAWVSSRPYLIDWEKSGPGATWYEALRALFWGVEAGHLMSSGLSAAGQAFFAEYARAGGMTPDPSQMLERYLTLQLLDLNPYTEAGLDQFPDFAAHRLKMVRSLVEQERRVAEQLSNCVGSRRSRVLP